MFMNHRSLLANKQKTVFATAMSTSTKRADTFPSPRGEGQDEGQPKKVGARISQELHKPTLTPALSQREREKHLTARNHTNVHESWVVFDK
jgi:hypothetical protein